MTRTSSPGDQGLHLHLDPVGGIAGDMVVGALIDARPDLRDATIAAVRAGGVDAAVGVRAEPHHDGVLTGHRFVVEAGSGGHRHVPWAGLRRALEGSALAGPVRERALAIFALLARAEALVHGQAVEDVTFHEVGAVDSVADIVAAAFLIEAIGASSWSAGPIPLGSGRVRSAHGELPVPAPAVVHLLDGYPCFDDGRPGERVTPTGAAILRHLDPGTGPRPSPRQLAGAGHGFGSRRFEGLSNVLRVLLFAPAERPGYGIETIAVVRFEVDDQTPEDLAIALDRLRALDGVVDVLQAPVVGKKGRMVSAVQLLVRPGQVEPVIGTCFEETTTLGVRWTLEQRRVLARRELRAPDGTRVKVAVRPGGATAKAEADDLRGTGGHAVRAERRRGAEQVALDTETSDD